MKIDTDIVLWNGNDRKKYRVIISVEAWSDVPIIDGKETRKIENHDTLKTLLNEFISDYNRKANEAYLFQMESGQTHPTQIGCSRCNGTGEIENGDTNNIENCPKCAKSSLI